MENVNKLVVAVSQHTVFLAESAIARCGACSRTANVPFCRILDTIGSHEFGEVDYILPVLGRCPACHSKLDEQSLVTVKPGLSSFRASRV